MSKKNQNKKESKAVETATQAEAEQLVESGAAEIPAEAVVSEAEVKAEAKAEAPKQPKKLVAKKGMCLVLPKHNMSLESDIHLEKDVAAEIPQEWADKLVNDSRGAMVELI